MGSQIPSCQYSVFFVTGKIPLVYSIFPLSFHQPILCTLKTLGTCVLLTCLHQHSPATCHIVRFFFGLQVNSSQWSALCVSVLFFSDWAQQVPFGWRRVLYLVNLCGFPLLCLLTVEFTHTFIHLLPWCWQKQKRVSKSSLLIIICVSKWFMFPYPPPESPAASFVFFDGCPLGMVIALLYGVPSGLIEKLKMGVSLSILKEEDTNVLLNMANAL